MCYLEINKNPNNAKKGKKAKALKALCTFAILTAFTISSNLTVLAEQPLSYGNYPVIRGVTNPQETIKDYSIKDASTNLRQMALAKRLGVLDTQRGNIFPNRNLTNAQMLKAMVKIAGEADGISDNDSDAATKYKEKAIGLGLIKQEEIDKIGEDKYMKSAPNMKTLNANLSKVLNIQTKYNTAPEKTASRLDLANLVYNNKTAILQKQGIDVYTGHITSKSSLVEEGKNKTLITVKLDKNIVIEKDKEQKKQSDSKTNDDYAQNQVEKITEDNKDDSTTVSYVNLLSQRDIPVLTPNGMTVDTKNILEQSQVNIYSKNNKLLYIEQFTVPTKEVAGVFESMIISEKSKEEEENQKSKTADNPTDTVKIKDYNNVAHLYKLHPDVKIVQYTGELGDDTAISKPVSANQLSYGQDVLLTLRNDVVTMIKAYVPVEEELNSYVEPESQLVNGIVSDISPTTISLTNNASYTIGPDTLITKGGEIQDYKVIKDGDRVKLLFDNLNMAVPSKIEVEGMQRQADKIVKAKVGPYMLSQKTLNLKDVKELQNGQWVDLKDNVKSYENIKIKGNVYANSSKVNANRLKNYKNQEIYAVIAKNQGIPSIEKGKIRIGDSLKFENSIQDINYSQNTLQIDTNLVKFDESTIIVKDGNIVQGGSLEKNILSNVETNLSKDAQIIIQTGSSFNKDKINDYPYKIYRAVLRDVFDYSILLGNDIQNGKKLNNYYVWQGGVWSRPSEGDKTPRINFTEQTKIYDYDNNKAMSVDQLRQNQNLLNESSSRPSYHNRQVYVVTKDDVAVSISFVKSEGYGEVNSQNMLSARGVGAYQSQSSTGNTQTSTSKIPKLLIRNIYQYNSNSNKLEPVSPIITTDTATQEIKKTQVRKIINIDKAMIILNGKAIQKTSVDSLKDKELTIIFRQTKDKKNTDNIEDLDAIMIIAN